MMRCLAFVCVAPFLLLSCAVVAQDTETSTVTVRQPKAPAAPRDAGITGTILCADTHRPARGAMVIITPVPAAKDPGAKDQFNPDTAGTPGLTRVESDGTYTVDHLAAGEYSVIAMLPGYLSPFDEILGNEMMARDQDKMRTLLRSHGTVTLAAHQKGRKDLSLQRGAAISGRVLFSDGSPASQVTIDLQDIHAKPPASSSPEDNINVAPMMRSLFMHQSSGTDDLGHYRISGIVPGTYRVAAVQATAPPLGGGGGDAGMAAVMGLITNPADLRVFSGDTLHRKSAKTYDLRAGDEITGIDITIPTNAFHRVQGHLATKDGRPIPFAQLTLADDADDTLTFTGSLGPSGDFTFTSVPSGTYTLKATSARIGTLPNEMPDIPALRQSMLKATAAFADGTTSLIVKDSDLLDVNLALTEVPLPPQAKTPGEQDAEPAPK